MKTVLLAATLTTALFSCQKSSDDTATPQKDFLGKYKITRLLFQSNGHPDIDMLSTLPECAQDDLLVFAADSLFKTEDAGLSCYQSEAEPTVWYTKGDKMEIDGVESQIISYDTHILVLATPMAFLDTQGTVIETLEKQ